MKLVGSCKKAGGLTSLAQRTMCLAGGARRRIVGIWVGRSLKRAAANGYGPMGGVWPDPISWTGEGSASSRRPTSNHASGSGRMSP